MLQTYNNNMLGVRKMVEQESSGVDGRNAPNRSDDSIETVFLGANLLTSDQQIKETSNEPVSFIYSDTFISDMNDQKLLDLDPEIKARLNEFIPKYEITDKMRKNYPNKYNIHFHGKFQTKILPISKDPKIVQKIRSVLGKLSPTNLDQMYSNLIELLGHLIDHDQIDEIAELCFINMIDNPLIVDTYIELLEKLEECQEADYSPLVGKVHGKIYGQLMNPRKFNNTFTETGKDKIKRWEISNGMLIARIYLKKKYSRAFLNKAIEVWVSKINPENLIGLEVLIKVLPLINIDLDGNLKELLNNISEDKTYPARLRLLLKLPKRTS